MQGLGKSLAGTGRREAALGFSLGNMEDAPMPEIETKYLSQTISNHTQDMTGKVVAITGTTSGTGYICARELAKLGALVLLLNRRSERSQGSLERLRGEVSGGKFEPVVCDLQDFESVKSAAREISSRFEQLDVLCNNAAVMAFPDVATKDGYDVQMQTNAISAFLVTKELFPLLKKSPEGRVVSHTSQARLGPDHEARYFGKNGGDLGGDGSVEENDSFQGPRWARYHQSKLANCTFSFGLLQRLERAKVSSVKVLMAHPGLAWTGLARTTAQTGGMNLGAQLMNSAQSAEDGTLGILRACADPEAHSGDFYGPRGWTGPAEKLEPEPLLFDENNIRICWEGCEAAVGPFTI